MLQVSIIPRSNQVHFNVPDAYVGKKIKVIAFQDDDVVQEAESEAYKPGNLAKFAGAQLLSDEERKQWDDYLKG
jgi:hypothetical protein